VREYGGVVPELSPVDRADEKREYRIARGNQKSYW
jgi:hypothetical protein